ncbi:RodZ domain-containing protein [Deltaproteobacteria bacterium TL4]
MGEIIEDVPQETNSIGQLLKEAREKKGYSLSYVTEVTRISISVLQAIETGNFEGSPGPVFLRGFIRTYAKLVGLEDDKVQEYFKYAPELGGTPEPKPSKASGSHKDWETEKLLLIGAVVLIIIAGVALWGASKDSEEDPLSEGEVSVATVEDPSTPVTTEEAESSEEPKTFETQKPSQSNTENPAKTHPVEKPSTHGETAPLLLTISSTEQVWLGVITDDGVSKEVLLHPGETVEWKAKERYQVTLGSTKNVKVHLNGVALHVDTTTDLLTNWVINKTMLGE